MASNPAHYFQPGNQLAAKGKTVDAIIRSCLRQDESDAAKRNERSRLRQAIESCLTQAAEGSLPHLDWLTCRLEGKAVQAVSVDDTQGQAPLAALVIAAMLGIQDSKQPLTIEQAPEEKKVDPSPPSRAAEGVAELVYSPPENFVQNQDMLVPTNAGDEV